MMQQSMNQTQNWYRKPMTTNYLGPQGIASPYPMPMNRDYMDFQTSLERRLQGYTQDKEMPISGRSASGAKLPTKITSTGSK